METETTEIIRFVEPVDFSTELQNAIIKTVVVTAIGTIGTLAINALAISIGERLAARKIKKIQEQEEES